METITISKQEYDRLKQIEQEHNFDEQAQQVLEDIKNDRYVVY